MYEFEIVSRKIDSCWENLIDTATNKKAAIKIARGHYSSDPFREIVVIEKSKKTGAGILVWSSTGE